MGARHARQSRTRQPGKHRVRPVLLTEDDEYEPGLLVREIRGLLASAEAETTFMHSPWHDGEYDATATQPGQDLPPDLRWPQPDAVA